ncbi:MAG: dihydrofolate reductase, partial [Melioribacteraceae bacterium]|nr:dihydrofolate reductase [Melioribacteraceae bacterium]
MVTHGLKRIIVAAVAQNGVIGNNNRIPWDSREELRNFRDITLNSPIIFGSKTYDSLKKKLDKRLNIVISSTPERYRSNNEVISFNSLKNAYYYLRKNNYEKVYICGGGRIYRNSIKHAEEMIIS